MQSVLVNIATFAVIVHMTIGCHWHHGFGSSHVCPKTSIACHHESDATAHDCSENKQLHAHSKEGHGNHSHDGDEHDQIPRVSLDTLADHSSHNHDHSGCQDDSCLVTQEVKTAVAPADHTVEYLGGVENSSIAGSANCGISANDGSPDCLLTMPGMRAHLMLCVLTL